jgi:LmbE family N-acetylglucosaminyl deacetylase
MHLFLSPHFDDAVLSCGGTIHRLAAEGQTVVVRTVMGGVPSASRVPDTPITRDLHQRWAAGDDPVTIRAQEEEVAVWTLGAQANRMVFWTDCVYRLSLKGEALYPSEESLFGQVHPDDMAGQLMRTLVLPHNERVRVLYAPMGAGHHVDHQIVRDWAIELKRQYREVALKFYEEYPYSEDVNAIDEARQFFPTHEPPIPLQPELVPLSEANVAAKVKAIRHYHTQISTWWADEAEMESKVRAALARTGNGQPAERFWDTE